VSRSGSLCLLLHSHMPYVEGFGTWPFGEEWLFEAVATSYLPLLDVLADAAVTLTITPVLADQLEAMRDTGAGERFERFVRELRPLTHAEDARQLEAAGDVELAAELRRAAGDYERAVDAFDRVRGDLITAIAALERAELWSSAATHPVLPLLATRAGTALQLAAGIDSHVDRFGDWDGGFWLPECAYRPRLEADLAEHGVRVFCVDQTDHLGLGALENLEPAQMADGVVAVPIDWQTICLVWDMQRGYPAAPSYRDYHRRTRYHLRPWNVAGAPYRPADALALARKHARDFVAKVGKRLDAYAAERDRPGLVCCALDTELLGHWWYEGPAWLRAVIEETEVAGLELRTVSDALGQCEPVERTLQKSSWGTPKTFATWDSPAVAEITFAQRRGELEVVAAASRLGRSPRLERAARELLALQSSDWAFQVTRDQAGSYPLERLAGHAAALHAALAADGPDPDPRVRNLQPQLDLSPLLTP
jgi:1,4-alpha-glucan branching enzyme